MVDLFFVSDMIMTFLTPYFKHNMIVRSYSMIFWNYLTGWFIIDIIAVLPFRLLLPSSDHHYAVSLRILKLPRLYRMVILY